ncbi:MAG: DUF433 domain-containing protein [Candidatus Poribacteria bacterium]
MQKYICGGKPIIREMRIKVEN